MTTILRLTPSGVQRHRAAGPVTIRQYNSTYASPLEFSGDGDGFDIPLFREETGDSVLIENCGTVNGDTHCRNGPPSRYIVYTGLVEAGPFTRGDVLDFGLGDLRVGNDYNIVTLWYHYQRDDPLDDATVSALLRDPTEKPDGVVYTGHGELVHSVNISPTASSFGDPGSGNAVVRLAGIGEMEGLVEAFSDPTQEDVPIENVVLQLRTPEGKAEDFIVYDTTASNVRFGTVIIHETEPDEAEPDEAEPDGTEPDETEPDEAEPDGTPEPRKSTRKNRDEYIPQKPTDRADFSWMVNIAVGLSVTASLALLSYVIYILFLAP